MPVVFRSGRYAFFFFSNEGPESPHIHVKASGDEAKYWLDPSSWRRTTDSMHEN